MCDGNLISYNLADSPDREYGGQIQLLTLREYRISFYMLRHPIGPEIAESALFFYRKRVYQTYGLKTKK